MKLLTGTSNFPLAESIAQCLKVPLISANIEKFSDGEIYIKIQENIAGEEVYIIQSLAPFVHEYLIELCILSYTLKKRGAKKVIVVIPYYAYARQDKNGQDLASLIANILVVSGIDHILTLDLHNPGIKKNLPLNVEMY